MMRCEPCRVTYTTWQVDDKCPLCGLKLTEVVKMETASGTVTEVMERKNKDGQPFWKGKIDGKTYNFNKKPESDTNIEVKFRTRDWTDNEGNTVTSRWVQDFTQDTVGEEMQNAQNMSDAGAFMSGNKVKGEALNHKELMRTCLLEAVQICNELNELADENNAEQIKWTTEDIRSIGNTMYINRCRSR